MKRNTTIHTLSAVIACLCLLSSCQTFLFGKIDFDYDESPAIQHKMPTSAADTITPPKVTTDIPNPDKGGAFDNWASCLVMFKEGHPHGGDLLHGNFVYTKAPWRQEMFAFAYNRPSGTDVEVLKWSTISYQESERGGVGRDYIRIIGGVNKLWGLCLYFFDKNGNRINDNIYSHSDEYQIFYTISDLDSHGRPYDLLDVRFRNGMDDPQKFGTVRHGQLNEKAYQEEQPIVSPFYSKFKTRDERAQATPNLFTYTYRDTWTQEDMGDGATELFNLRLLPPSTRTNYYGADPCYDQDNVGLKGHLRFDMLDKYYSIGQGINGYNDYKEGEWPIERSKPSITGSTIYSRTHTLLPQFYLSVRVMKCQKGTKTAKDMPKNNAQEPFGKATKVCDPYYAPGPQWTEIIRFNIPIKVYTNMDDSDPTCADYNEPYYVHLAREIGLTPEKAFNEVKKVMTHGNNGGFASWFL